MPHSKASILGLVVRPPEDRAAKVFEQHAQVLPIPRCKGNGVAFALEEDAADTGNLRHRCSPFVSSSLTMATFSAHTASPPRPSRTPAGSRASSRHASIAPRTTSARDPLAWAVPRTRTHRSIPAPPTPAGASRLPRAVPYPTPA